MEDEVELSTRHTKEPIKTPVSQIAQKGVWTENPAFVQLLGMCPLLAISTTLINGLSLGLATIVVMTLSNLIVSLLQQWIPSSIRIPTHIMIAASLVTLIDLLWQAFFPALYRVIGIFVPLIITNCIVLARIESFATRHTWYAAACDGFFMGLGSLIGLSLLGIIREILGYGTIGRGIHMFFKTAQPISILGHHYTGFLLATLPPGAFFTLALLITISNTIKKRQQRRTL